MTHKQVTASISSENAERKKKTKKKVDEAELTMFTSEAEGDGEGEGNAERPTKKSTELFVELLPLFRSLSFVLQGTGSAVARVERFVILNFALHCLNISLRAQSKTRQ